ncbi:hypothetical protein A5647_07300 [Mycobacterium sp. 1100029.7]|nr:hypothetical protein A5647_07300 [Mycobacterium sp. 1100029.7]
MTAHFYYLFIAVVGVERLVGLVIAHRNAAWSMSNGGKEFGSDHFPAVISTHALLLVSCLVEVWALGRPFVPWLGGVAIAVVALTATVRWHCTAILGKRWNPRLIVFPGTPVLRRGPDRWLRHRNYLAVAAEVAALPLVHSAWLTAMVFTMANALVLHERIRLENAALAYG